MTHFATAAFTIFINSFGHIVSSWLLKCYSNSRELDFAIWVSQINHPKSEMARILEEAKIIKL